jgi:hypothetical protein
VKRFGKSDAVEEAFKMGMWPRAAGGGGGGGGAGDAATNTPSHAPTPTTAAVLPTQWTYASTERLVDLTHKEHLARAATDAHTNAALWVETMHTRMGGFASSVDLRYLLVVAGPNAPSGDCLDVFPRADSTLRKRIVFFKTSDQGELDADVLREAATMRHYRPPFYPLFVVRLKAPSIFGAPTCDDAAQPAPAAAPAPACASDDDSDDDGRGMTTRTSLPHDHPDRTSRA